jgi:hypothetical protein
METTLIPLKLKYRQQKTMGRYHGGENFDKNGKKKRNKTGKKNYVYGSRVMYMDGSGKTVMGGPR